MFNNLCSPNTLIDDDFRVYLLSVSSALKRPYCLGRPPDFLLTTVADSGILLGGNSFSSWVLVLSDHRSTNSKTWKVEAIPTIIMAFAILLFLPSFPFSATFLTTRERAIAQARLNRDQKPQSHGGMTGWQGFKAIISDINAWLFMIIYASCEICST